MTQLSSAITQTLTLSNLPSLAPSPYVNQTLGNLVSCIVTTKDTETFNGADIQKIRSICSQAEGELESFWAKRIAESDDPTQMAHKFPYWDNYSQLTAHEIALLQQTGLAVDRLQQIAIIGSGPLPMSAIHLRHHASTAIIDHIDNDNEAVRRGTGALRALGIQAGDYMHADGQDVDLTQTYDLILIAALAGETLAEKQKIIDNILPNLSSHGRILIRSAKGVRGLLYPVFEATSIKRVCLLAEYHPNDDTINSVFIYGKETT